MICFIIYFVLSAILRVPVCGDGTIYGNCSVDKPYYCLDGKLIELASVCGCHESFTIKEDLCLSKYTLPKNISLNYTLRGENYSLNFVVYKGFVNYLAKLPRSLPVINGTEPTRLDFELLKINDSEQRILLIPLIKEIQNAADNEKDRVRIAVSLIQEIPFGNSGKTTNIAGYKLNYSRYPYEVLYDLEGVCGEKSELLLLILKEMGYKTAFFYYQEENHEAVGLKCPFWEGVGFSGYCFIETTGASIISDNKLEYSEIGRLRSRPEILKVSEGARMRGWWYEYFDAWNLNRLRKGFAISQKNGLEKLKEKYNLGEEYNI